MSTLLVGAVLAAACGAGRGAPASSPAPTAAAAPSGPDYTLVTDASLGTDDPNAVWVFTAVTERPRMLRPVPLIYPDSLQQRGIGGNALVEFIVDTLGRVEPAVRVIESSHPALADPARRTIRPAQFKPGHVQGRKVRVMMTLRFQFVPKKG